MKKYAVAVADLSSSENEVKIVDSSNEVEAIKKAVEDPEADYETVEEAIIYYFDGDILVSKPILIGVLNDD